MRLRPRSILPIPDRRRRLGEFAIQSAFAWPLPILPGVAHFLVLALALTLVARTPKRGLQRHHGPVDSEKALYERIAYDLRYISHWSLWFDIRILLRTMVIAFRQRHAY
jgi:hypothetical protein